MGRPSFDAFGVPGPKASYKKFNVCAIRRSSSTSNFSIILFKGEYNHGSGSYCIRRLCSLAIHK